MIKPEFSIVRMMTFSISIKQKKPNKQVGADGITVTSIQRKMYFQFSSIPKKGEWFSEKKMMKTNTMKIFLLIFHPILMNGFLQLMLFTKKICSRSNSSIGNGLSKHTKCLEFLFKELFSIFFWRINISLFQKN